MRVSRAQAEENRMKVIEVASRLFREHGFDGIGLNDLMKGAGLTQGGFYKQFESKEDLAAQASKRAMETTIERWTAAVQAEPERPFDALVDFYLSPGHRSDTANGCAMVALGADAGRHGDQVKASFEAGIRAQLDFLERYMPKAKDEGVARGKSMATLATMVGAILLSRAVDNEALSKDLLAAAKEEIRHAITG